MKVFILLSRLHHGGAEMRTLQMIEYLTKIKDIEFYVYLTSGDGGILVERYEKVSSLIFRDKNSSLLVDYMRSLKDIKPHVIHINANLSSGFFCFVAKLLGFNNSISHIRTSSDYSSGFFYRVKKFILRIMTNTFSKKVVGVCNSANKLTNSPMVKWVTIYNGFVKSEYVALKNKDINIVNLVMVGRLDAVKNHQFAFKIVSRLKEVMQVNLSIYGIGSDFYLKSLKEQINTLNLQSNITFFGDTNVPLEVISKNEILLLPSVREGLPGVVIEAMSVGVPSICSDLDGCVEICNFSSSIVCIPADDVYIDDWCSAIIKLKSDADPLKIVDDFALSPFCMESHCNQLYSLWNS